MVLEQHVVLVCGAADAPEDVALHELVHIGPEPVDDLRGVVSTFDVSMDEDKSLRHGHPRCSTAESGR